LQAKSTQEPIDLEDVFEKKLTEMRRDNTTDSLKDHAKYKELEEHIENAVQSNEGSIWFILCTQSHTHWY